MIIPLFESISKYMHGECGTFAYAFHDIYGGSYVILFHGKQLVHIVNVIDGVWYDASGKTDLAKLTDLYKVKLTVSPTDDEADIAGIYGDRFMFEDDIADTIEWIKTNMDIDVT